MVETLYGPHAPKLKPSIEEPPTLELKTLPSHLKYAFLEKDSKLPVVISSLLCLMCRKKIAQSAQGTQEIIGMDYSRY